MLIAYTYKLKPSKKQASMMAEWLNMLRAQYNFCLRDRIESYEQVKAPILGEYCRLDNQGWCCPLTCCVNKTASIGYPWKNNGKRRNALEQQDANLPELKKERPWYKSIHANVLQMNLRRLNEAFQNFFEQGRGYPKFKTKSKFRSLSYKPGDVQIDGNWINFPKIGKMRFYNSRPIPDGFEVRTVTLRLKSDGWYMSVRLEYKSVRASVEPDLLEVKTAVGVDLGIRKLASISNGEFVKNPQFSKQVERRRSIRQRCASRKQKGSKNRAKAYQRLAKLEHQVANQRTDYQWKVANKLVRNADAIIFEDLNVKAMMARCKPKVDPTTGKYLKNGQAQKKGLNRAIADAAWGELKLKTKAVAAKLGAIVHEVNPQHTSQQCNCCGYVSPTNRKDEKFLCEQCGYLEDADLQASKNILERGLKNLGIDPSQLRVVHPKVTLMESDKETSSGLPDEPENPVELTLFDLEQWRGA
jgi:putative transposase